jgi:MerR family transcriptional regulator, light-induced transcriptional regulator
VNARRYDHDEASNGTDEEASGFVVPGSLAARYLDCLLASDKAAATHLVDDALARGLSIRELYLGVIQQTQYEVGRLWELNLISVAQEHFCTGVSQLLIARLYSSWLTAPAPNAPRAMVACVDMELHELGARMVADFLEMDGWDTTYLGANAAAASIAALLRKRRTDLLAISSTLTTNLRAAERLIEVVRELPASVRPRIVVGGYAFLQDETTWRRVGADGYGRDAEDAVRVACALTPR